MVDFAPMLNAQTDPPATPTSPTVPKSPLVPTSPVLSRRVSSSAEGRSPSRPDGLRRRHESSAKMTDVKEGKGEATLRGVSQSYLREL